MTSLEETMLKLLRKFIERKTWTNLCFGNPWWIEHLKETRGTKPSQGIPEDIPGEISSGFYHMQSLEKIRNSLENTCTISWENLRIKIWKCHRRNFRKNPWRTFLQKPRKNFWRNCCKKFWKKKLLEDCF